MLIVKLNPNNNWCPQYQDICQKDKCMFYVHVTQQKLTTPDLKWTGMCSLLLQNIKDLQWIDQDVV